MADRVEQSRKEQLLEKLKNLEWLKLAMEFERIGFSEAVVKIQDCQPVMIKRELQKIKLK